MRSARLENQLEKEKSLYASQIEENFARTRRSEKELEDSKDELLKLFTRLTQKEGDVKKLEGVLGENERQGATVHASLCRKYEAKVIWFCVLQEPNR
jgi:hypothetical protein